MDLPDHAFWELDVDLARLLFGKKKNDMRDELAPFMNLLQVVVEDDMTSDQACEMMQRVLDIISFVPDCDRVDLTHSLWANQPSIAFLHYRLGNADYYLTHRDRDTEQRRAYGAIDVGGLHPQHDFFSLHEILRAGAAIDLDWVPRPTNEIKARNADF